MTHSQVGIPLETGQKVYEAEFKLKTYLKIARLYLEDDDPVQAEYSINRATLLQSDSKDEELKIIYKFCYAKVLGECMLTRLIMVKLLTN